MLMQEIKEQQSLEEWVHSRKSIDGEHRAAKRLDGVREGDGTNKAGKDGEQREGGNVILWFILEQLLPHLSDGYQLC